MTKAEIARELRQIPFFARLPEIPLGEIAKAAREKQCQNGQMVFFENEACDGFYYIVKGSVKIFKTSPAGREQILHTFRRGDTFAEVPTFDNGLCPANAQAVEDCSLLLVRRSDFENIVRSYPEVAFGLLHHFAHWLKRFTIRLEELSLKDVNARLAKYLLRLADESGKPAPEGITLSLQESQQEIASQVGTVREVISRTLHKFQDMGLISLKGRRLTILDRDALEDLV